jgi:PAS domain S-box-containing protein
MAGKKRAKKGSKEAAGHGSQPPEELATTPADVPATECTGAKPGPSVVDVGASTAGLDADAVVQTVTVASPVVAIFTNDLSGTISSWSQGAERKYGYSPGEAVGRSVQILVPDDRTEEWSRVMSQVARGDHVEYLETERIRKDGRRVAVALTISPMRDGDGKLVSACVIGHDITDRKGAVAALRDSEEKLRQFIEHAPLAIAMFDRQMHYLAVSRRWLAEYYRGDGEITGRSHYEVFPEIPARWRDVHQRGLKGEVVRADDDLFRRMDGTAHWVRWEVRPWKQADGTIGGIVIFAEDMSVRKRTEEALVRSEERFRIMADHAPVMIWMSGTDRQCSWVNKPWLAFVGRSMAQELGNGWTESVHPDDVDHCLQTYTAAFDARQQFTMEYQLKRHDGKYRWILDTGIPVYAVNSEFTGYIGSCVDITDRKCAEERLRTSEARMQAILNTATDAIVTIDYSGIIQSVNPATERLFGYASAELIGQNVKMLMSQPYRDEHGDYLVRYLETGQRRIIGIGREVEGQRKDGSLVSLDLAVSEVERGKRFTGILRDITRRKELEREIVEIASLEQRRIGQDLHDDVGQDLTGLAMLSGSLVESLGEESSEYVVLAQKMVDAIQSTLLKVRLMARGLAVGEIKPEDLPAALADLTWRLSEVSSVRCVSQTDPNVRLAGLLQATHFYHIAQEACNNAIKHARARNLEVSLRSVDHAVILQVRDDGVGMPARPTETNGLGLRIMRNRAAIIGAHLTIDSAEPSGTLVACRLVGATHQAKQHEAARPRRRRRRRPRDST